LKKYAKPEKNCGRQNLLLILDSNEYIFALGKIREPACEELLRHIAELNERISFRICRLIVNEVRPNLTPEAFKEFMLFVHLFVTIDEDNEIPFELGVRYEAMGFKPADAFIAAYTEYTGAEILVSENRHFLSCQADLPFKVCNAEKCLKLIKPFF
jgi:hypothetical protein